MEKECRVCLIHFHVKRSRFNTRFCCSIKCQSVDKKNKSGSLNNNWRGGPKKKLCPCCNKLFVSKNPYNKVKFCSHKCSTNYNIGKPVNISAGILELRETRKRSIAASKINKLKEYQKYTCKCGKAIVKKTTLCLECVIRQAAAKKICKCGNKKNAKSIICFNCYKRVKEENKKYSQCISCGCDIHRRYRNIKYCSRPCFKKHKSITNKGESNPNWRGGVMDKHAKIRASDEYIAWRTSVFKRDNYTCKHCGQLGHSLHAHHIKPFATYIELRTEITNGITLCKKCHNKVHTGIKRPKTIDKIINNEKQP